MANLSAEWDTPFLHGVTLAGSVPLSVTADF